MEKSSKRGKIPQTDWPLIMARYEAGETLASIARTYDCSAPAISYIVGRNRGKSANEASVPTPTEPQLIKAHPSESATTTIEPAVAAPAVPAAVAPSPSAELAGGDVVMPRVPAGQEPGESLEREDTRHPHRDGSGDRQARPAGLAATAVQRPNPAAANGEPRPKLHLSLGNGNGSANGSHAPAGGNGHAHDAASNAERPSYPPQAQRLPQFQGAAERVAPKPLQGSPRSAPFGRNGNGRDLFAAAEGRPAAQAPREDGDPARRKDNGAFIDQELRTRVDGDIAAFLAAFDAALAADTLESRFSLREATDRLLRAGARTRIELERLEARVPLTPRDSGVQPDPGHWRHR
ncbi:MAG TPA: hypothetical protein VET89_00020 [Stellaceae bacterium]|nr:hypothetical protein [Stellaceae bacterium]